MGQGPIRTVRVQPLREMILHGPVIFMRDLPRCEEFHTEVHNWRLNIGMAALRPGYMRICGAPLKKSYNFLLAYDMRWSRSLSSSHPARSSTTTTLSNLRSTPFSLKTVPLISWNSLYRMANSSKDISSPAPSNFTSPGSRTLTS